MSTEASTRTARLPLKIPLPQQIACVYVYCNLTKEWIPLQCTSEGKVVIERS